MHCFLFSYLLSIFLYRFIPSLNDPLRILTTINHEPAFFTYSKTRHGIFFVRPSVYALHELSKWKSILLSMCSLFSLVDCHKNATTPFHDPAYESKCELLLITNLEFMWSERMSQCFQSIKQICLGNNWIKTANYITIHECHWQNQLQE